MPRPKYPVRVLWPDGSSQFRSIFQSFAGLTKRIEGEFVRPTFKLEFDPEEIRDPVKRAQVKHIWSTLESVNSRPIETPPRQIKTIQEEWENLERMILDPKGAGEIQRREMRNAFFAGAFVMYQVATFGITALSDEAAEQRLREFKDEFEDFFRNPNWLNRN